MFGHSYAQALRAASATRLALFTQAVLPVHPVQPIPVHNANKSHLKKLKIKITLDGELKVDDCFMCCDDKQIARLGCSHEYCVDCIVGSAKVRTKSFISCAVCRMEVKEIQVPNAAIKKSFSEQIKKE